MTVQSPIMAAVMPHSFKVALVSFAVVSETPSVDVVEFDTGEYKSLLAIPRGAPAELIDERMDAQRGLAERFRRLLSFDVRAGYPGTRVAAGVDLSAECDGRIAGIKLLADAEHVNDPMIEEIRRRAPSGCQLVLATTDVPHAAALSGPDRVVFYGSDEDALAGQIRDYLLQTLGRGLPALPKAIFKPKRHLPDLS
jgi:hypothetical protein